MQAVRFASNIPPGLADRTVGAKSGIPLHVGLDRNPEQLSALSRIPIPKGEKGEVWSPSVLARPLGLQTPPERGQNSPRDLRTFVERRRDFTNPEKAAERQRIMMRSYWRPYFQDRNRTRYHGGKSFVSNKRLFRRDKALYFPNVWGPTLAKDDGPDGGRDLAPVLQGKISIISMQNARYAEMQVDSFLSSTSNPDLEPLMTSSNGRIQRIDINMQTDFVREFLVRLSVGKLRKQIPEERWDKYFRIKLPRDIRRGLTEDVRDAMGVLNAEVGYVYLVDSSAKIRWAGSGDAWEGEVDSLNAAVRRLLDEEQSLAAGQKLQS